jgi:hypothetical protein
MSYPHKFVALVRSIVGNDFHAKRVESLANGVIGCAHAATLGVRAIGAGLASARGLVRKHAIKQVDRLLSNNALDMLMLLSVWVKFRLAGKKSIKVAMDWTDFEDQDHTTLNISIISSSGRAEALYWKTFQKSKSKGNRVRWEQECIEAFAKMIPEHCKKVHFVADRGFGGVETQEFLTNFSFLYTIRLRNSVLIPDEKGQTKASADWAPSNGAARLVRNPLLTGQQFPVAAVIVKHAKEMKEAWVLATNGPDETAGSAVKTYSRRFSCEEMFRDIKDPHFGMGLLDSKIKNTDRRDRLLWLSAVAQAILSMLGRAGEETGLSRYFRADTRKKRKYNFFRQGVMYYDDLPMMREEWAVPLLKRFDSILTESGVFSPLLGLWK